MKALTLEPHGESGGHCECCGKDSRTVWGLVASDGATTACYYAQWTIGHVADHGANFDLVIGRWGEMTGPGDREVVCLDYRLLDSGPAFRVIDAGARADQLKTLAAHAMPRSQVVDTSLADQAFAIADLVLAQDARVSELLGNWTVG